MQIKRVGMMQAHVWANEVGDSYLADRSECEWNGEPKDECGRNRPYICERIQDVGGKAWKGKFNETEKSTKTLLTSS